MNKARSEKRFQVLEDYSHLKGKKGKTLLKKRQNEELAALDQVFGEFESFLKKAKIEQTAKVFMTYEHERNRMASALGEKSAPRSFLGEKIKGYREDVPLDILELVNEDIENLPFLFDPNLAEEKLQEFNRVCDVIENSFQNFMEDQCRKIGSLDFPQEPLIVDVEPKKIQNNTLESSLVSLGNRSIKINSCLRFIVNNQKLRIRLNPKIKKISVVDLDAWEDIKEIKFSFKKLEFDESDLQALEDIFSKLTHIQTIILAQDPEMKGTEAKQQEKKDLESSVPKFMKAMFSKQQDLKAIQMDLHSYEEGNQVIKSLGNNILSALERKILTNFEISFTSSCTMDRSIKDLLQSLSLFKGTLESVALKLPDVSLERCLEFQSLNLPKLYQFTFEIDCGYGKEDVNIHNLLFSSLRTMKLLESLDIKLYSSYLNDQRIISTFTRIGQLKDLRTLSWKISQEKHDSRSPWADNDYNKLCRMVSLVSKSLLKMSELSNLWIGFGQNHDEVQNQEGIANLVIKCRNYLESLI